MLPCRKCAFVALLCCFASSAWAQTIPEEYSKRIAHHSEAGTLTDGFAGEHIDLSSGALEIIQTDIDLPGNNALPVRVGRRFEAGDVYSGGHFRYWSLDIPNMHGTFGDIVGGGWEVESPTGGYTDNRCTSHGAPPTGFFIRDTEWNSNDYWHGTFFYLPGSGNQELLQLGVSAHLPADGHSYHAMTKAGAVARCVTLASTSDPSIQGEGFEMVTPDGVVYTLNQMVTRHRGALRKATGTLPRKDYILFPTKVTDRFGNTVTYVWSTTNPWQLLRIDASDGRRLDFSYTPTGELVSSVSDGTYTWRYTYSASTGPNDDPDTLILPDTTTWSFNLARLVYMPSSVSSANCTGINGITQRTTYDDGTSSTTYSGSITGPSGATATFTMARILLGRSYTAYNCVSEDDDPTHARPNNPYLFQTAAVVGKAITGPGLPTGGLKWSYSYGPTNNCWAGTYSQGISCTGSPPVTRSVLVTEPEDMVTRYTFGNRANVDEGLLYTTEYGWDGAQAKRTVQIDYADPEDAPYAAYSGWSPRGSGDYALTSKARPQRKITTTQQDRNFTWEVASDCSGVPHCFDAYARPTKVIKSSAPAP